GVESAQFTFHTKRASFVRASAGDHTTLVTSTVGRDESILWVFAGEFFGCGRAVGQVSGAEAGQELFGGGAEWIAEVDQLVQAGEDAVFHAEGNDRLVFVDAKIFGGVDEESSAAADFIAKQRDAGAGMVEGFDDNVFEFVAEVLFDGAFVKFGNFGVVGEDADGAEILAAAAFINREKFLHSVRSVRTVVKNLG